MAGSGRVFHQAWPGVRLLTVRKKKTQAFAKTEKETENQKDTSHAGTALDELDQWLASAAAEWLVWVSGG